MLWALFIQSVTIQARKIQIGLKELKNINELLQLYLITVKELTSNTSNIH